MTRIIRLSAAAIVITAALIAAPATAEPEGSGRMMLVLDSSGSMHEQAGGTTRIDVAKHALDTVIDGLPASQEVGLRVYGAKVLNRTDKGACTDSQRVVNLATGNRDALKSAVAKYKPYGETPTGYALQQAGKDLGKTGPRTIVLVSDGEPTCAPDPCKVAEQLTSNGIDVHIDVVGLDVSGKARESLQCVAAAGKGTYYDASSADELTSALRTLATRAALPYSAIGRRISGTQSKAGAPKMTPGDWVDTIGGTSSVKRERYYRLDGFDPTSTLHISASIRQENADKDSIQIQLLNAKAKDGFQACIRDWDLDGGQMLPPGMLNASINWSIPEAGADDKCKPPLFLRVSRSHGAAGGEDANRGDAADNNLPVEIRVIEEPHVKTPDLLPAKADESNVVFHRMSAGADPARLVSGTSFANAPTIKPGSFTGNIVPGEAQIVYVDLDWGQRLQAEVDYPTIDTKKYGNLMIDTRLDVYSPARARSETLLPSNDLPGKPILDNSGQIGNLVASKLYVTMFPVAYNNRDTPVGAAQNDSGPSLAGKYALVLQSGRANNTDKSLQIPFTMELAVDGTPKGKPAYTSTPKSIGSGAASTPVKKGDDGGLPILPIGLGVAGILILGAAYAVFRKSRSVA